MRQRFYRFFVVNVVNYLYLRGHDVLVDNKYGVVMDMTVEKVIIPRFNIGFVQILFVRDNEIVDRFITRTGYRRNAEKKFKRFYRKRMLATLAEVDGL